MTRLIVNADDFGMDHVINDSILKGFREGIVTSTSLMANGKAFDHAVKLIKSYPALDIGIHLSLVDGSPILNASQVPTLVNTDHKLLNHAVAFSKKYFCGQISISEVKVELKTQIEKVLDNGIRISHIDSHQHVHILPRIFQVVTELAEQYKIKYIRIPNEKFQAYMFSNLSLIPRVVQLKAINYLCSNLNTISSKKNDFFYGFYFGGQLNKKNLIIILKKLPQYGLGELMCHPGNSADAANLSKIDYRKENELAALTDEEVKAVIVSKQIRLTSFKEMADVHE